MSPRTDEKKFTQTQFLAGLAMSFGVGLLLFFLFSKLQTSDSKPLAENTYAPLHDSMVSKEIPDTAIFISNLSKIKKNKEIQARFGGQISKDQADQFTFGFSSYLRDKVQDDADFKTFYTAGTWYTIEELANFLEKILSDNPTVPKDDIRIYFCPSMYPNLTKNPYTGKDVGLRESSCMIALKKPYDLIKVAPDVLNIKSNVNYLGAYNWGGLEP